MPIEELIVVMKERREELGVTQEYLADLADVSLRTLKKIESGRGNPTLNTMNKLLDVLGLELKIVVKQ